MKLLESFRISARIARTKCWKTSKLEWVLIITQREITARMHSAFFAPALRPLKIRWETVSLFRIRMLATTTVSLSKGGTRVSLTITKVLQMRRLPRSSATDASTTLPMMWNNYSKARKVDRIILMAALSSLPRSTARLASSCLLDRAELMLTRSRVRKLRPWKTAQDWETWSRTSRTTTNLKPLKRTIIRRSVRAELKLSTLLIVSTEQWEGRIEIP